MRLCRTWEEIIGFIDDADRLRPNLPYDTDGAVVKVDRYDLQRSSRLYSQGTPMGRSLQVQG